MTHSLTLCEFGFEESDFIYFAIASRYPKALPTSTSRNHRITFHDPFFPRMRDIGISESGFTSLGNIYNNIDTPVWDRDIGGEDNILVHLYTCTLAARCNELERDRSDIARLPVGDSDRVEFEHMILVIFLDIPRFHFFP